jgi:exonuclease III
MGVNCAGLSSKVKSFDNILFTYNPSIFFLQETKMRRPGKIKSDNIDKYFVYELTRKESGGGGIAIGVQKDLDSAWISEGDDAVEILVVEVNLNQLKVRCICGYGPQESDKLDKKEKFWNRLSNEVEDAQACEAALIFQMDGNLCFNVF